MSFRSRVLLAIVAVVTLVTGTALWVAQRTMEAGTRRAFRARFEQDVRALRAVRAARLEAAEARCLGQQLFGSVAGSDGRHRAVDRDAWRVDAAVTVRPTPHVQVKLQYGWLDQAGRQRQGPQLGIVQLTLRF